MPNFQPPAADQSIAPTIRDRFEELSAKIEAAREARDNLKRLVELEAESTVGQIKLLRTEGFEARQKLISQINENTTGREELITRVQEVVGQVNANTTGQKQLITQVNTNTEAIGGLIKTVGQGIDFQIIKNGVPGDVVNKQLGELLIIDFEGMNP